jgi:hypothetical protein
MVTTYYPEVLPPDTANLAPKIQPLSRQIFSKNVKRSYRLVLRDESLAIDYIPDYCTSILVYGDDNRPQITGKGHLLKRKLTPYHIWVLKRIAQKFADTCSEKLVVYALKHYPEQFSFLTYLETLRNAQRQKQRSQQTRRRCRIVRTRHTA